MRGHEASNTNVENVASQRGSATPQVVVAVLGRFHGFDLARELHAKGRLATLLTSYPRFAAARHGVPRERLRCLPANEVLARALRRANVRSTLPHRIHDTWVRSQLRPGPSVFVGWSGCSVKSLRRARELGMFAVVERGSSHIQAQAELLAEEYARAGVPGELPHPETVAQELEEYAQADAIAVPSEYVRRTFLERGVPAEKLLLSPYGVSLDQFVPAKPPAPRPFRVAFCGALSARKGIGYLLEAFRHPSLSGAELLLIGSPQPETRELVRHAPRNVRAIGSVPQAELPALYQSCHAFCLPSIEEGMAMVQLQALACGLPVVCTTNTGGEGVIRDGVEGFVVPIRSPAALAEALGRLANDPALRLEMSRRARDRVASGYSWADYAERSYQLYVAALTRG